MSSLQSLRCVASKENAQMMLKDKMSIISASRRPTAKINPFLESSFGGHFTVADAVLVEAMNVGQKSEQFHGTINLFFKKINDQVLHVSTLHWSSHWIKKFLARISSCPFYDFRKSFRLWNWMKWQYGRRYDVLMHWRTGIMLKKSTVDSGYFVPVV